MSVFDLNNIGENVIAGLIVAVIVATFSSFFWYKNRERISLELSVNARLLWLVVLTIIATMIAFPLFDVKVPITFSFVLPFALGAIVVQMMGSPRK